MQSWSAAVVVLSSMGMILYGYFASRKDDPKPGAGPWGSTAAVNVIGMLIVVPMALLSGGGLSTSLIDWGLAMVVVLTGGVVGMWFALKSLHLFSSPVVMAFSPLAIVLTAVGAAIFIGQPLPATAWLWFAVIAIGLFGIRNEKLS